MDQVTDSDVAGLVEAIRRREAPTLARNCLLKLRAMFAWAMLSDRRRSFGLEANPVTCS
ncbi:hypothetical protein [Rhizobium sp. BK060]|uniref:hypothetical protein n=1 Tax=Rhizobium sp. BK060 TaxID=2587096 RepID=UPI00161F060B|nr:hypothetical protein [Rhizobium sp. BK060]